MRAIRVVDCVNLAAFQKQKPYSPFDDTRRRRECARPQARIRINPEGSPSREAASVNVSPCSDPRVSDLHPAGRDVH